MELTEEQLAIINSQGNIKINAVAGSGKTTTVIEYAKSRPANSRILYLVFNKSAKMEAEKKFAERGVRNVRIETAHSLAFHYIVKGSKFKVSGSGYKSYDVAEALSLPKSKDKLFEYIISSHILKLISYYCNSAAMKLVDVDYLATITDPKAHEFVHSHYKTIETQARNFLAKMYRSQIEITHDFYLKLFQLSQPELGYDYILFDEGQDASGAMLDVFMRQQGTKVIVGDTHQQIYSWRYAVNSLEQVDFKTYFLSSSFRFDQNIADLAMRVLGMKDYIGQDIDFSIIGKGKSKATKKKAVLARSNLALLLKAIEFVTEKKSFKKIYFEGNINSYTYADEGTSLYDVLYLHSNRKFLIKDKLLQKMKDTDDLTKYVENTDDKQLGMMLKIVKQYGNKIPGIINEIKSKHVGSDERDKAEMIFSTVHKSKGLEYDVVQLTEDFISEKELELKPSDEIDAAKTNEEINLLYVAITRAKHRIFIPQKLMPQNIMSSKNIICLDDEPKKDDKSKQEAYNIFNEDEILKKINKPATRKKNNTYEADTSKNSGKPWTEDLDTELTFMYNDNATIDELSDHFGRSIRSIEARLQRLGMVIEYLD